MRQRLLPALLAPLAALAVLAVLPTGYAAAAPAVAPVRATAAPVVVAPVAVSAPVDVNAGQAEVAALNAEVERTTAELTAGTVRLEQGQARLAETQARADQARAEADAALARAAAAKAQLGRLVNAAYRTPRPDNVTLALGAQPGRLEEVVLADAALDHVRGNQEDALREATAEGDRAQQLVIQADALQEQAAAQARDLVAQVAALQVEAADTRTRLEAAAARLEAAQAATSAADAAALSAAAGSLVDVSGAAALCTGTSTAGYPNGLLPASALCPLAVGDGHRLRADAAAAFNRLYAAYPVCVTDSYRTYGAQVDVYARKPGLAAIPGTSNHGLGLAVDLCGGIESFGTPAYQWMKAHAPTYGFVHPAWAEPGGNRPEPWHWEFNG